MSDEIKPALTAEGFTWMDVDCLRDAAEFLGHIPEFPGFDDLADRIAALLPPRDP